MSLDQGYTKAYFNWVANSQAISCVQWAFAEKFQYDATKMCPCPARLYSRWW